MHGVRRQFDWLEWDGERVFFDTQVRPYLAHGLEGAPASRIAVAPEMPLAQSFQELRGEYPESTGPINALEQFVRE